MSVADPAKAMAAFLTASLGGRTSGNIREGLRIFQPRLPKSEEDLMPWRCAVITRAGGGLLFAQTFLPITDSILEVTCYGSSRAQANVLADEVALACQELRLSVWEGTTLKWARIAAAPQAGIDDHSNWPESVLHIQVCHSRERG